MSAFMQSDLHFSYLCMAASFPFGYGNDCRYYYGGEWLRIQGREQEVGQILKDQNVRSVDYRYRDNPNAGTDGDLPPFVFSGMSRLPKFGAVAIILAVDGYIYQAEETPDWEETEAYAIAHALREHAIRKLEGYSGGATWSI